MSRRPSVCIVTPALANANNGNWQTARRWAGMLSSHYRVVLVDRWQSEPADVMVALHARRSAPSIERWAGERWTAERGTAERGTAERPEAPLAVVLTGTDLYADLPSGDGPTQRSLALADRLVVLHDRAIDDLPAAYRAKAVTCFQSTPTRPTLVKTSRHLRALMVGHLRAVKAPQTYFAAARRLVERRDIRLDHIGAALEPALGDEALALQAMSESNYRWLGALPHTATRRRIQRAHLLVNSSLMEGGAHVLIEAMTSGTPVLASHVAGNIGLLGLDYDGYFEPGDGAGLAALLERCRDRPAILERLQRQCDARAPLFEPVHERAVLHDLLAGLLKRLPPE